MTFQVSNSKVPTLKFSPLSLLCAGLMLLSLFPLHAQAPPAVSAGTARAIAQAEADRKANNFAEALARLPSAGASSADRKALLLETADVQFAWGMSFGDSDSAQLLAHCRAALAIDRTLRPNQAGNDFNGIGLALVTLRRYDEAIRSFRQAQVLHHQAGNGNNEAVALINIGTANEEAGRQNEAITAYRQAAAIYQRIGDKDGAGYAFSNIGDAYNKLSQYSNAALSYQQSLVLSQQADDKSAEGSALGNLGNDYSALRQYEKALDCYQELLPHYTQLGNGDARAGTLDRLGNTCRALGQYHQAVGFYRRALAVYRQEGERDKAAKVLADMKLSAEAAEGQMTQKSVKEKSVKDRMIR